MNDMSIGSCDIILFQGHENLWLTFMLMDMFRTLELVYFQTKQTTIQLNQHFLGIINSWIVLPMKLNV